MAMVLGDRLLPGHAGAEGGQLAGILDILDRVRDHLAGLLTAPQCLPQNLPLAEELQMLIETDAVHQLEEMRMSVLIH